MFLFGKYINKYYKKYWYLFLIGIAFLVGVDALQLMVPEALGEVISIIETTSEYTDEINHQIFWETFKIVLAAIAMFIGRIAYRNTIFRASTNAQIQIGFSLFDKSLKLDLNFYHNHNVGSLMSYYTLDILNIQDFFGWGTVQIIDASFMLIYTVIKMFMTNVVLSLIIIAPLILIAIWGALVEKYMEKVYNDRQDSYSRLYDFVQESFTGIRVIKAFVKENSQINLFLKQAKENKDISIKFNKYDIVFLASLRGIIALITSIILGMGGYLVYLVSTGNPLHFGGENVYLSVGQLVTYLGYFTLLVWPVIAFGQTLTMFSRAKTSSKRITEFLDTKEDIDINSGINLENVKGKIEFKDLSFTYPNSKESSLKNINLTINEGEHVGIIGKIGSGKSTLINLLLHLYNTNKNSIFIDGIDMMDINVKSLRDNIAIAPQDNLLFSDTIENNVMVGKMDANNEEVINSLKNAAIFEDIQRFPEKEKTSVHERGVVLSGGQKQRVSIARAFIKDAPILILDDSLNAVDTKTELEVLNTIKDIRKNKTTIFVSSRVSTIKNLDRIIVLNNGKLEAFDKPDKLFETSETYKKMYTLQKLEMEI